MLLAHYGITAVFTSADDAAATGGNSGMDTLEHYLAGGHKVIVGVNAELIWGLPVETKDNSGNPAAGKVMRSGSSVWTMRCQSQPNSSKV